MKIYFRDRPGSALVRRDSYSMLAQEHGESFTACVKRTRSVEMRIRIFKFGGNVMECPRCQRAESQWDGRGLRW